MSTIPALEKEPAPVSTASESKHAKPVQWWWVGAVVMPIVLAVLNWSLSTSKSSPNYVTNIGSIRNEFLQITGQPLTDALTAKIERALELGRSSDTATAIAVYKQIVQQAPLPSLYNNLGVLYAKNSDKERARNAFARALEIDGTHEAAIRNTAGLKTIEEKPVAISEKESEPNNSAFAANVMRTGSAVAANIDEPADVDVFQFTSGTKSRDWVTLDVKNLSEKLLLSWRIIDASKNPVHNWQTASDRGAYISDRFPADPGAVYYVQIAAANNDVTGRYVLTVNSAQAYDRFEPNDEPLKATPIRMGQTVEASILERQDVDTYQVDTGSAGGFTVSLQNQSQTLAPSMRVLDSMQSVVVSWTGNSNPGGHLELPVQTGKPGTHYIQVSGNDSADSAAYQLIVK